MSNRGTHPEIGSIIRKRDEIHTCLFSSNRDERKPLSAIEMMIGLLYGLEDKDTEKETGFIDGLKREIGTIDEIKDVGLRDRRFHSMRFKYWEWYHKLNKILWDGKYLLNQKYGAIIEESEIEFG